MPHLVVYTASINASFYMHFPIRPLGGRRVAYAWRTMHAKTDGFCLWECTLSAPKVKQAQTIQVFQPTSQMHRIGANRPPWCLQPRGSWGNPLETHTDMIKLQVDSRNVPKKRVARTKVPGAHLHQRGWGPHNSILLATGYALNATPDHRIPKAFHTCRLFFILKRTLESRVWPVIPLQHQRVHYAFSLSPILKWPWS